MSGLWSRWCQSDSPTTSDSSRWRRAEKKHVAESQLVCNFTSMFFELVASICHVAVSFLFMIVWIKGFRNSSTIETPEPENARSASGLLMIQLLRPLTRTPISQQPVGEYVIRNSKTQATLRLGPKTENKHPRDSLVSVVYIYEEIRAGVTGVLSLFAPSGDFLLKVQQRKEKNSRSWSLFFLPTGDLQYPKEARCVAS